MLSRRNALVAGGSLLALPALSGCLGDDATDDPDDRDRDDTDPDENGDPADDDEPVDDYEFGVGGIVYTTERARAFGEYTPHAEEVYRDGETIWLYLEVTNVTPPEEDGPAGPDLDTEWALLGPDGEEIVSTEETARFPEDAIGALPNEGFVTQGIETAHIELPASGEYTVTATITDRRSGESIERSRPVTIRTLEFDAVVFTDGEPTGVDEYVEKPDATYAQGEAVWVYTEVTNPPVDDSGKAVLEYIFEVEPPVGEPWEPIQTTNRWERVEDDEFLVYWRGFNMFEDDPTGPYEMTITVDDKVTRTAQIQTTETFVVA